MNEPIPQQEMQEENQPQPEEQQDIINELLEQNQSLKGQNTQLSSDLSAFAANNKDQNIAQYQIDTDALLERLEHFYKGEYLGYDEESNQVWKKPEDKKQIPFNDFGVASLMEIVSKYLDKNTVLSYYTEERIYEILSDLGEELLLFILSNYETLGMDTYFKKTKYRTIVVTTLHMVESTYRRALRGRTIEEINQSRIVTQSDLYGGGRNVHQFITKPQVKSKILPF